VGKSARWILCALPLVVPLASGGEEPVPQRPIALLEAVRLALERNLTLAAQKPAPKMADAIIVAQMAIFDPTAYANFIRTKKKEQSTSDLFGEMEQTAQATIGLTKLFPTGTTADIHLGASREWNNYPFVTVNPAYNGEWGITVTQPLLRGFGIRANTAGIAIARDERNIVLAQLRDAALQTAADTMKAYWELVFAIQNRQLLQRSLERAQHLLEEVQARVEAGVLGERDPSVAQAKAEVSIRQEEIVVAEDAIRDAEELLKTTTELAADPAIWKTRLVPVSEPPTDIRCPSAEEAVQTALQKRPDYRASLLAIRSRELELLVRRNQILPKLDAVAGGGHTGVGATWDQADHSIGTLDYYNWSLGLNFEYPLWNRAAKSRARQADLQRQHAVINLRALQRQIQLEVRTAIRQVATNMGRLRAAEASVRAEEERLRAEEIRFREARVGTGQDVLDAQAALAQAEIRRLRALIDLNNSAVEAKRLMGTLLEAYNIVFEEE